MTVHNKVKMATQKFLTVILLDSKFFTIWKIKKSLLNVNLFIFSAY